MTTNCQYSCNKCEETFQEPDDGTVDKWDHPNPQMAPGNSVADPCFPAGGSHLVGACANFRCDFVHKICVKIKEFGSLGGTCQLCFLDPPMSVVLTKTENDRDSQNHENY